MKKVENKLFANVQFTKPVSSMMQRYQRMKGKLSDKGFNKLDDDIYLDQHLRQVAEKARNWEEKSHLLNLSQQNVSDLKDKYGCDPYNLR